MERYLHKREAGQLLEAHPSAKGSVCTRAPHVPGASQRNTDDFSKPFEITRDATRNGLSLHMLRDELSAVLPEKARLPQVPAEAQPLSSCCSLVPCAEWEQCTEPDTASGASPAPAIKESTSLPPCTRGRAAGGFSQLPISELQCGGRKAAVPVCQGRVNRGVRPWSSPPCAKCSPFPAAPVAAEL